MSFKNESVVEIKSCQKCQANFNITDKDLEFYDTVSPKFQDRKYSIPTPKLCPECRQQRRLVWRNEHNLYKRKCSSTGKDIISIYSPDKPHEVYDQDFWWTGDWTLTLNSLEFDFDRSFFDQFYELTLTVPKRALCKWTGSFNCDYANLVWASKDSYCVFNGTNSENCMYISGMSDIEYCVDATQIRSSSYCYEGIDIVGCHGSHYLQDCLNCSDSSYLLNCVNCQSCFWCVNIQNKKYCIFNKQYSREDYKTELQKHLDAGFSRTDLYAFALDHPRQALNVINSENASWDTILNSSDIKESYDIYDAQNIAHSINIYRWAHDCMDVHVGLNNSNKLYESALINKACSNLVFCYDCWNCCDKLMYCSECKLSKDCFGCTGLVWKQYCILNKQYTQQEYEEIVPKIIDKMKQDGEWWEFFPASLSPVAYNETIANEYFPLTKQEAKVQWFNWSDYEAPFPKVKKTIPASKLPTSIADVPDDILNWAVLCEVTDKPFRIVKQELEFYRKHNLPIPKRHPHRRHLDRMNLKNPKKLFGRNCDKCKTKIQTAYAPDRKELVYCQSCYEKEVY